MRPTTYSYEWVVSGTDTLDRIDKFIAIEFEEFSRTLVQKMIEMEYVLVNSKVVKANYKVKVKDYIQIEELPITLQDAVPQNMDLDIVYEDDDVIVVYKPSGMVTHPAPGHYQDTLVNGLIYHTSQLSNINGDVRPGIIHRIDKDTSGLLMVAKNDFAHQVLAEELKLKATKREYYAIVEGVILNQKGTIHAPIARSRQDRKKMAVIKDGKDAVTHFEVLERFENATLIKCILETGRTHQIRVHMAYINYPLLGDSVYGKNNDSESFGQYLHAKTLGFTHPTKKEWMEFDSDLPLEFTLKIKELRNQ